MSKRSRSEGRLADHLRKSNAACVYAEVRGFFLDQVLLEKKVA